MKTNLDKHFKQDDSLEKNGVWFEIEGGVKFLVRRFGGSNVEVKKAMTKYYKPVAKLIEKNLLDDDKEKEIVSKAFIASCIVEWDGVVIDDEEVPYSMDVAIKLFKGLPELLEVLMTYAQDVENYKEYCEESVGN